MASVWSCCSLTADEFLPFHDNSAARSFAHAPLHAAGNTNARAQCTEISIPKRDGHTNIPTQSEIRSRISCLALRRSAIKTKDLRYNVQFNSPLPITYGNPEQCALIVQTHDWGILY